MPADTALPVVPAGSRAAEGQTATSRMERDSGRRPRPEANPGALAESFGGDMFSLTDAAGRAKDATPHAAEADAPMVLCRRCKHPLTRPPSVARRFGPTCWRRILDAARAGGVL